MCHQVIQIFKCGHNSEPKVVRCKEPTKDCEAVFLREELAKVKELCEVCLDEGVFLYVDCTDHDQPCGRAAEKKRAEKAQASRAVDEGYWS